MQLVISSEIIGTDSHLLYDGKTWKWSSSLPEKSLLWGFDHPRDLQDAAISLGLEIPDFKKTPWGIAQRQVQENLEGTKWIFCMPRDKWMSIVSSIVDQLWMNFTDKSNSYYVSTHIRNREIAWKLQRPIIDVVEIEKCCKDATKSVRQNLNKFLPDKDGLARRSVYSFCRTVTGRMTIVEGPNILTTKKENRKIIKSRYKNGKIVEIDLQSAEPRVALALFGKYIQGDIYEKVISDLNIDINRDTAKIAILSAIYGASHHALKQKLPRDEDSIRVLDQVKEYFGIRHIEKLLKEQHEESNCIFNTHGRKIFSETPSVNHLIQSSTVDISHDVFDEIIKNLNKRNINFCPLYLIHDAIILDIDGKHVRDVHEICKDGFISSAIKTRFPVSVKEIR